MVLTAVRGALGFLTRLPLGHSEDDWRAFGGAPAAMVPAGYLVGALVAVPLALTLPTVTVAIAYPVALLVVTGITHADGLADVADAAVIHGSPADRLAVLQDTTVGVGGTVALVVDVVGLALAGVGLATLPASVAVGLVVGAEVGAKLAMVAVAVAGSPARRGLGSHLTGADPRQLVVGVGLAAPAAVLVWPTAAGAAGLIAGLSVAVVALAWARTRLGGVTGDVLGATNELARLTALHVGVVTWTLS